MPGVEAVRVVGEELLELDSVLLHPVDRIGRAVDKGAHHAGVAAPVAVIHDHHKSLVLRDGAFDGEDAFREFARAAHHRGLFERHDLEAFFRGGPGSGGARGPGADHDDVGVVGPVFGKRRIHGKNNGRSGGGELECMLHDFFSFSEGALSSGLRLPSKLFFFNTLFLNPPRTPVCSPGYSFGGRKQSGALSGRRAFGISERRVLGVQGNFRITGEPMGLAIRYDFMNTPLKQTGDTRFCPWLSGTLSS